MARALLLVVVFLAVAYTGAIKDSMHVSVDEDPVAVANIIKERIRRQAGSCDAADIAFVLDSSGSIQKTDSDGWNKILTFAKRMVGTFNVAQDKTRIAVMTFSGNIGTIIKLNQYGNGAAVQNAIGNLAYRDGPTNTPLALRTLNEVVFNEANGDRKDIANFALTMTDGVPNMQNQEVDHVIDMISKVRTEVQRIKERPQPITMFAIGVALDKIPANVRRYGNVTLETIASRPSYTFSITDFAALDAIHDVVVNAIGEACRTSGRECYIADLAFMIDSSGSIQRTDAQGWSKSKEFAKAIIEHFPVAQDKIRVAVLTFSSNIGTVINFKDYGDRQKLIDAVMRLQFLDGTTDTPKALERLDSSVFTVANGDRAAVPDFVVALTDGVPNTEGEEVDHVRMMVGKVKTAADKLKNRARPITMFAIGIALDKIRPEVRQFGQETLNRIASKPSYAFSITDFDALETIVLDIKNSIKDECGDVTTTTPAPTTPVKEPDRPCKENTDVYFIVDESGSIGYQNFELMKKFVSDTVDKLNIASDKTQVGLITFSTDPSFKWGLNKYSSRRGLRDAVSALEYKNGRTETWEALAMLRTQGFTSAAGDRSFAKNIVVVITDGGSQDTKKTVEEAVKVRQMGITVLVVAVGGWVNRDEIRRMSSDPDSKNLFEVNRFNRLGDFVERTKNAICNDNNDCNVNGRNPCQDGARCVDLINDYYCICPSDRVGKNCDRRSRENADIVFALDSSGSIGWLRFWKLTQYIKGVILNLDIAGGTRVGLLTYSSSTTVRYYLNTYKTKAEIYNATDFVWNGGTTDTAAAIRVAHRDMFTSGRGDQSGRRNILVVVTDGQSNDMTATLREAAIARNQKNIEIIVVGVKSDGFNYLELNGMATDPDSENVIRILDFDTVDSQANINKLSDYVTNNVNECEPNPCKNGGTCTDHINEYLCRCPVTASGRNCEKLSDARLDLVIVMDSSGSVHYERFEEKLKPYVKYIVNNLEVASDRARVGLVTFATSATARFYLNTYNTRENVLQAIDMLPYSDGRTNTQAALRLVRTEMFSSGRGGRSDSQVTKMVILLTDGVSTVQPENTLPEAIKLKQQGVLVVSVLISGDPKRLLEIKGITSGPRSAHLIQVDRWNNLANFRPNLEKVMFNDVKECNSNPCQSGGRCLDTYNAYTCVCSGVRSGRNCERTCNKQFDVAFVIDRSGSMEASFEQQLNFVREVIYGLPWQSGRTRVGVVLYDNNAKVDFRLDTYTDRFSVLNALNYVQVTGGKTNTAAGINEMINQIFGGSGDRRSVTNRAFVVSDGNSNINSRGTLLNANDARRRGIELYAIGIGNKVNLRELNNIANDPDSSYAYTGSDGRAIAARVLSNICS